MSIPDECRNLELEEFDEEFGEEYPPLVKSLFERRYSGPHCKANFPDFMAWKKHNKAFHEVPHCHTVR